MIRIIIKCTITRNSPYDPGIFTEVLAAIGQGLSLGKRS